MEEACARPEPGAPGPDVFVSRQPVVDGEMRVTGYRVAYATLDRDDGLAAIERSATRLFGDVLSVVGLQELVGSSIAHLPVSRELLLTLGVPPLPPDRVMLRLAYDLAIDPELHGTLDTLAGRGYALGMYDLPGADFELALLDVFGTVEIDCSAWDSEQIAAAVPRILAGRATPLAEGLLDHGDCDRAKALGFQLFTGPFFASPRVSPARRVPIGDLSAFLALAQLHDEAAIEQLERAIDRDLGLSVRLLRYINSAYFGMRNTITSLHQAVMMLGVRGLSRWALLVALTGAPSAPRELSVMALTRARMCELLGARRPGVGQDELFTVGLLSAADALLGLPLETIVQELPLADEIVLALLRRAGTAGEILDAVLSYERGSFDAECLRPYRHRVTSAYWDALGWAQRMLAELP